MQRILKQDIIEDMLQISFTDNERDIHEKHA